MSERRRLTSLQLTGTRATLRELGFWALVACCVLAAIGYVLPTHRVDDDPMHSHLSDGGWWPLVVYAALAIAFVALRRARFGGGILAAIVACGGCILSMLPIFLRHFMSTVHYGANEDLYRTGTAGLFLGGALFFLLEPALFVAERRATERCAPEFPTARVV